MLSAFWSNLVCSFWWVLFGGLLGLLGSWLLGRLFRTEPPPAIERIIDRPVDRPVDRVVEKVVEVVKDNPVHLAAIAALTAETAAIVGLKAKITALEAEVATIAGLRSQLAALESAPPKTVEKIVEKPVDRIVDKTVEVVVEKKVEVVVEKPIEVVKDNPAHLATIAALMAETAVIVGMKSKITAADRPYKRPYVSAGSVAAGCIFGVILLIVNAVRR